LVNNQCKTV